MKLRNFPSRFQLLPPSDRLPESFFSDMAPRWKGVPTATKMEGYRLRLAKSLRRKPFCYNPDALALSETLENCRVGSRCHSAGCPECLRAAQWYVASHIAAFNYCSTQTIFPSGVIAIFITIIPTEWQQPEHGLYRFRIAEQLSSLRRALMKMAAVKAALLGVDFSFNDNRKKRNGTEYWQPHIHGVMWLRNVDTVVQALRKLFPKSNTVNTPVQVKVYDGTAKGAAYCFKTYFERRVAVQKKNHPTRKPFWTTRTDWPLRVRQKVELALFLDKIGMRARVLSYHRRHESGLPKKLE
jgi:hypothetical protein